MIFSASAAAHEERHPLVRSCATRDALRYDAAEGAPYGIPHGRDEPHDDWPELFMA